MRRMSRKAKPVVVDEAFRDEMLKQVESMSGVDKVLVNNLIEKLCSVNDLTNDLLAIVRTTGGPMIDKEVGTVNNRHIESVENPALTSYSKMVKVLADVSMKVSRVAKGSMSDDEDGAGDLVNWNRAH